MLNYMYKLHLKNVRSQIPLLEQVIFMSHVSSQVIRFWVSFGSIFARFWVGFGSILGQFWINFGSGFG